MPPWDAPLGLIHAILGAGIFQDLNFMHSLWGSFIWKPSALIIEIKGVKNALQFPNAL